jgi:hypothetical protein
VSISPPKSLGVAGRAEFRHGVTVLRALNQDPALSRAALQRYARACDDAAALRREWDQLGRPALRDGGDSGRMLRAHPLLEEIRAAERLAADLGDALGLSPLGRRRLRIGGRGIHRAPDRRTDVVRLIRPDRP